MKKFKEIVTIAALLSTCLLAETANACSTHQIQEITAGDKHSMALNKDGNIYTWGRNASGELGLGFTSPFEAKPNLLNSLDKVVAIDAGWDSSAALLEDGSVWRWGHRYYLRKSPEQVDITDVKDISIGDSQLLMLKNDGTVWSMGTNQYGELGNGTTTSSEKNPVQVENLDSVVDIQAGSFFSLALKSDGTVWSWGDGTDGKLGNGSHMKVLTPQQIEGLTDIVSISTQFSHSAAVKSDGTLYTWGNGLRGQLGNDAYENKFTPVIVSNITDVKAVSTGIDHTIALKKDGTVWAWGYNSQGQIGDGTRVRSSVPVQADIDDVNSIAAGGHHSLALKADGTVWAWGYNNLGQVGDNKSTDYVLTPKQIAFE